MIKSLLKMVHCLCIVFYGVSISCASEIKTLERRTKSLLRIEDLKDEKKIVCINECKNNLKDTFYDGGPTNEKWMNSIIKALENNDKSLKDVNFHTLTIDDEIAKRIATSLKNNTYAKRLKIDTNYIGFEGGQAFVDMLKENKTLEKLDFAKNRIGDEGALLLLKAFYESSSLIELDLSSNIITTEGAKKIEAYLIELLKTDFNTQKKFWLGFSVGEEILKLMPTYEQLEINWKKEKSKKTKMCALL